MTFFAYQGVLTSPAAGGAVNYTNAGFQPTVVIFWNNGWNTAGDQGGVQTGLSFAYAASLGACMNTYDSNGSGTSVTGGSVSNGAQVIVISAAGALRCSANMTGFLSTGFTLNWGTTVTGYIVHYLALGGTDVLASGGNIAPRTTAGSQSVTGLAFQPKLVLFLYASSNTASGASAGYGWAASATNRWATSMSAAAGATMASNVLASRIQDTTKCVSQLLGGGSTTVTEAVDLTSMNSDGFTMNWTTATGTTHAIYYLALGGAASYALGTFTKAANTTQTTITVNAGTTATPGAYMLFGSSSTSTTAVTTGWSHSIGGTDGTRYDSVCWEVAAGVLTAARTYGDAGAGANSILRQRAVPTVSTASGATQVEMDHSAFTTSGFTVALPVNTVATAWIYPYVTFGPAPILMPALVPNGPAEAFP